MSFSIYGSEHTITAHNGIFQEIETKTHELQIKTYHNATIFPISIKKGNLQLIERFGGVSDEYGNFIEESGLYRKYQANSTIQQIVGGIDSDLSCQAPQRKNETVVFLGVFYNHWGHFLLESLARFHAYLKDENKKYKAVYIAEDILHPNIQTILKLFAFESIESIHTPTQFETVLIPEPSCRDFDFMHTAHIEVCKKIAQNIAPAPIEKIYFTRANIKQNHFLFGEKSFENLFLDNSYKVFAPEKLSLTNQIALIKGAKNIAGVAGSALHTILFTDKEEQECIQLNRFQKVADNQVNIIKHTKSKAHFVECQIDIFPNNMGFGPFLLVPTEYFVNFCEQNKMHFNYSYFRNTFHHDLQSYCLEWFLLYNNHEKYKLIKNNMYVDMSKLPSLVGAMLEKISLA